MFQRILVPVDGSVRAERAIPVAARMASASGGSVILVQAVSISLDMWPIPALAPHPTMTQTILDADIAEVAKYLAGLTVSADLAEIPTETAVECGPTASTILSTAYSYNADVIVMCSHGYTGMTRWVLGSVAEKVARHASIPVLILREGGSIPLGPRPANPGPFRVLVPLDGSARAKAALTPAAYLAIALSAPARGAIHLVRVVKPAPGVGAGESEEKEDILHEVKSYLSSTTQHLQEGLVAPAIAAQKLTVTWSVAVDTDPAEAIVRVAENGEDVEGAGIFGGCDVIVMATHGRSGLQRWAMGSVTDRVLNATRLPLLIVRPPDMMEQSHLRTTIESTITAI
jgi:nucleotide-binding universal stress UspA family protein